MKSINSEIISEYITKFKKSEEDFIGAINKIGKASLSSEQENMSEKWDVKLEIKFDVKALKKVKREDDVSDENIHWVELKANNGSQGWLYSEEEVILAFETNDYWILVSKLKLQKLISEKCSKKEHCKKPELYKLYNRAERKDVITLVKTIDLIFISDKMIPKNPQTK